MNELNALIVQLNSIRNQFGKKFAAKKMQLLHAINNQQKKYFSARPAGKKVLQSYYNTLLFIIAYPDNKTIYKTANQYLQQLQLYIHANENLQYNLYNTGITGSSVCAAFSFEMVKWLRITRAQEIKLSSFEMPERQIQSILSAVMPKTASEILQDANAEWRGWLGQSITKDKDLLDQLIAVFDSTDIRPEVKDELWNAIGINVEINFADHCFLPGNLVTPYFHRSLIRKNITQQQPDLKPIKIKLTETEAEQIIDCSRMILVRHLREIDPISFTAANLVSYYQLPRGYSVALMGMVPARRHPIDSYLGYCVFKNGLPVGYAGSWILFNSGRIGLNIFPAYRGGESQYLFQQVLELHRHVYSLKRFTVDPYQLGKENSDGIHSGAFWVYYHAGFRPLLKSQQELAASEALKIKTTPGYRSSPGILTQLAACRMEWVLQKNAVNFDATDLSLVWAAIVAKKFNNNLFQAQKNAAEKTASILKIKNFHEEKINFVLKNWSLLLLADEKEWGSNHLLKTQLKKLVILKAAGSEEVYINELQHAGELRKYLELVIKNYAS